MPEISEMANVEADYDAAMSRHYAELEKNRREVIARVDMLVSARKLASIEQFIDDMQRDAAKPKPPPPPTPDQIKAEMMKQQQENEREGRKPLFFCPCPWGIVKLGQPSPD